MLPPPVPAPSPPGWYPDPWRIAQFRWWDGRAWTANIAHGHGHVQAPATAVGGARTPRLPAWLSPPILWGGLLTIPLVIFAIATDPAAFGLSLVPILIVAPALMWLDRVEPEPRSSRLHAFLWGATISIVVAGTINSIVAVSVSEAAAAVVSAPLVEESMKGLAVLYAVRRLEVDGVIDGLVYAGWAGLGFAVVENMEYFLVASEEGVLAQTFVARALLTPFAHPLFTAWIGLAVGLAVARGRRVFPSAIWGWMIAVALHAAWNGSIVAAIELDDDRIVLVAAGVFVLIFLSTVIMVVTVRRREQRRVVEAIPMLTMRYGLRPGEIELYNDWHEVLRARRQLPREQRRQFDEVHGALARLAALHARPGGIDRIDEERLVSQLEDARSAFVLS